MFDIYYYFFNKYIINNFFRICWTKFILISVCISVMMILLLIPLIAIFMFACAEGLKMVKLNLMHSEMVHAVFLTIFVALCTVPINAIFGTLASWLIARFKFFGRDLLFTILNIPIAVSPIIAGLLYMLFYSNRNSIMANWLNLYDIQIMFTWIGIVLVTIFVTYPFVIHELVPVMIHQGSQEDEAAILLGASGWKMFFYVTFPNIKWALLYGIIITNARAIGEFGAVSIVSGLIRGETYTLSLYVELLYQEYNTVGAFVAASLLALISIMMLYSKFYLQGRLKIY